MRKSSISTYISTRGRLMLAAMACTCMAACLIVEQATAYPVYTYGLTKLYRVDTDSGNVDLSLAFPAALTERSIGTIDRFGQSASIANPSNVLANSKVYRARLSGAGELDASIDNLCGGGTLSCESTSATLDRAGQRLYVGNVASPRAISIFEAVSGTFMDQVDFGSTNFGAAMDVAITPDGRRAFAAVLGIGGVDPSVSVDLSGSPVASPISDVTGAYTQVVMRPDGRYAYFSSSRDRLINVVDAETSTVVGSPLSIASSGETVEGIVMSPDGNRVYVAVEGVGASDSDVINAIDTRSNTVVASYPIGTDDVTGIPTVLPKGDKVVVPIRTASGNVLRTLDISSGQLHSVAAPGGAEANLIALSAPDQAPAAAFNVASSSGSVVEFDASGSSDQESSIAEYRWAFGDGQAATTSSARISHNYGSAGTRMVSLTVTDANGTSTTEVYDGHRVLRNGGSPAQTSQNVAVSAPPVPAVTVTPLTSVNRVTSRAKIASATAEFQTPTKSCVPNGLADVLVKLKQAKRKRGHTAPKRVNIKRVSFSVANRVVVNDRRAPFSARVDLRVGTGSVRAVRARIYFTIGKRKKQSAKTISRNFRIC